MHVLAQGHAKRDQDWHERFRKEPGEDDTVPDLYAKHMADPALGRAPSRAVMDQLRYAAEHSGKGADA